MCAALLLPALYDDAADTSAAAPLATRLSAACCLGEPRGLGATPAATISTADCERGTPPQPVLLALVLLPERVMGTCRCCDPETAGVRGAMGMAPGPG